MTAVDVAFELRRACRGPGLSAEHLLHRLSSFTARLLPGCCGTSIAVWEDNRIVVSAVSHPDLAALRSLPRSASENPERQVMLRAEPVTIPDTLTSAKWRAFSAAAAGLGLRSVAILPMTGGSHATFGFYASRPRAFEAAEPDLALIADEANVVLRDAEYQSELASEAHGVRASLASRSIVDQAIGIIVAEHACSPQQALAEMQRLSQRGNIRLSELARSLVARRSPG